MKKYTTILILLMLAATALAQRTEQREQKSLLILPSRDGRRQSQQEEKIQELRQFAKEQGFTEILNNRNYDLFSFSKNWQFTHFIYLKPQVDAEHTSDGIETVTTEIDSIGHQERLRFKMMNDSVRSAFLSLAPSANNVDMYEFHKNGVDTIRYVLQFNIQPNSSTDTTRLEENIESLKYTFTQGPTSDKQTHLYRADLVYNYYEAHKRTTPTLDTLAFQAMLDQAIEPLIKRKMAERFPIEWRFDRNYRPQEGEVVNKRGLIDWYDEDCWQKRWSQHMGLVSGVRYFIPKKYEQEELALFHTIDSLTLDYIIQHPTTPYGYNGLATSPLWSTGKEEIIIVSGLSHRNFGYSLIRHIADDGVHYLFMITPSNHLWYPSNFTKLRKWENGVGTPLPTPTPPPSPTFLYSTHSNVTVQEVRQTKEATTLVMNYQGSPYGLLSISSSTRLVDEQGQPVPITGVDEFALDSTIILPQNGKMDFTLHFKPLPKGTRIFDLIEGQRSNEFRIYGITDGTQRIKVPVRTEAIDPKEVTEASLRPDSVCIIGHIANYDRQTMPRLIRSEYHSNRLDFTDHSKYPICCRIDSLGYFTLAFLADHAVWNFLDLVETNRRLPFLVHPGDTLQIDIENYGQWNEQVRYRSQHGHNVGSGLMHLSRDLYEYYYTGMPKVKDPETYLKETEQFYKGKSRFYDYIVWKYRLTPWEAHLLTGNLSMDKVLKRLGYLSEQYSEYFTSWSTLPEEQRPDHSERFFKPKETAFLREVNWNDPSLAFQSGWLAVSVNYFMNSPLQKFVFDTMTDMNSEAFREKLLEEFPNMAPNLVEEFIRQEMPRKKLPVALHREETYTPTNPAVQRFIASLLPDCKSELLQLMFIDRKNALNLNKWYDEYHNIIEDFSDNPQLSFILVIEGDAETLKQEQGLRYRFPKTQIRFVPTETFLELCEGLRICHLPNDVTLNNKGQIHKSSLNLRDERFFRENLKRLQEALAKSAKSSQ